jgi:hypothetical protein
VDPRTVIEEVIMIPKELAEQVRSEVKRVKEEQEKFLQSYKRLCSHLGGHEWEKGRFEIVFHQVRHEVIPVMEQAGMDQDQVQAFCAWAENRLMAHVPR